MTIYAIILPVVIAICPGNPTNGNAPPQDSAFNRAIELRETLDNEGLWTDPSRREVLLNTLQEASDLRNPDLIPVLIKRLSYTPYTDKAGKWSELPGGRFDSMRQFPAFRALVQIGLPAVPAALQQIATTDTSKDDRSAALSLELIYRCYRAGGFAERITRERIKIEAEQHSGIERDRLLQAADHIAFKARGEK